MCSEEFLSSALLHLQTQHSSQEEADESSECLQSLCTLFNLVHRAKHKKSQNDIQSLLIYLDKYGTSLFEMHSPDAAKVADPERLALFKKSRALKLEIERS